MTREITISNPNFDKNKNEILLRASIKTYVLTGRNVGNYLLQESHSFFTCHNPTSA